MSRNARGVSSAGAGRDLRGADWDLCTTLAKFGKCDRQDCKWGHESAEWWEGAWWQLDDQGRSWGWWQSLPVSEECPVSLNPICSLQNPPFELQTDGSKPSAPRRPGTCIQSGPAPHRFDAVALAKYLVGSGQFMDPVNRRPLKREECVVLDKHTRNQFGVAEAFAAVKEVQAAGGGRSAASREIAVAARQLFVVPSATAVQHQLPQTQAAKVPAAGGQASVGFQEARTVHTEGGLRVIDDSLPEVPPTHQLGPVVGAGLAAPTPSEALASRAGPKPKRAPRPQRPGIAETQPADSCRPLSAGGSNAVAAIRGANADRCSSSVKKAVVGPVFEDDCKTHIIVEEPSTASGSSGSAEAWIAAVMTPELQAAKVGELSKLDEEGLICLLPDRDAALAPFHEAGSQVVQGALVNCEVPLLDDVVVQISVPALYPTQTVAITQVSNSSSLSASPNGLLAAAASAFERDVRLEAAKLQESGDQPLTALVHWLSVEGPGRIEVLNEEVRAARRVANPGNRGNDERLAEDPRALEARSSETARTDRLAQKYSSNWDLCTGFLKTGKCKNKHCQWRHEMPAPKNPELEVSSVPDVPPSQAKKTGKAKSKK